MTIGSWSEAFTAKQMAVTDGTQYVRVGGKLKPATWNEAQPSRPGNADGANPVGVNGGVDLDGIDVRVADEKFLERRIVNLRRDRRPAVLIRQPHEIVPGKRARLKRAAARARTPGATSRT